MADQSDVENALVALASDAIYPNGLGGVEPTLGQLVGITGDGRTRQP